MKNRSDQSLLSEFKKTENQDCIAVIYERYQLLILGVAYKYLQDTHLSEDVRNEVFIRLIHEIPETDIQNLRTWLFTVAKHLAIDSFRRQKTRRDRLIKALENGMHSHQDSLHEPGSPEYLSPEDAFIEKTNKLREAFQTLSAGQQKCLNLFFFEELSYQEISTRTGLPLNQIKSYIQNGKRLLKKKLSVI